MGSYIFIGEVLVFAGGPVPVPVPVRWNALMRARAILMKKGLVWNGTSWSAAAAAGRWRRTYLDGSVSNSDECPPPM